MTKEEKRQLVVDALIAHQQQIADTAQQEMDSAQQQSNDYGANVDRYDSFRTKMMRSRDMYARQLSNANASIRHLQELQRMSPAEEIAHGSVVITDKQRFFLSVGAGKFSVPSFAGDGTSLEFFAISAQVPIFKLLQGKKEGDTITFNGIRQKITEVF